MEIKSGIWDVCREIEITSGFLLKLESCIYYAGGGGKLDVNYKWNFVKRER